MAAYYSVLSVVLLLVAQRLSATQLEDKTAYTDRLFTYQLPSHQDYTEVRTRIISLLFQKKNIFRVRVFFERIF